MITVRGSRFGPTEVVDLAFDLDPRAKATTDDTGAFSRRIRVPSSAQPGAHTVSARGETSGLRSQTPFTVRTDWPMPRFGPEHTGLNPYENVLSAGNVSGLELRGSSRLPPPSVASRRWPGAGCSWGPGTPSTPRCGYRALLWSRTETNAGFMADPAVWRDRVFYASDLGIVRAVDAATGDELWSHSIGASTFGLTLSEGVVYLGAANSRTYALDARTGEELWRAATGLDVVGAPAVSGGVVYVAADRYELFALDATSGAVLWTGHLAYTTESSPAVAYGMVFVGSDDNTLYAYPAAGCGQATCDPVWTAVVGEAVESSPAVAYGMVFVGSDDHNVYAFDARTGRLVWTVPTESAIQRGSAAVANGIVYIGSKDGIIRAIAAFSGQVLWTYATAGFVIDGPVVADGWVFTGSFDHTFYAFHLPG